MDILSKGIFSAGSNAACSRLKRDSAANRASNSQIMKGRGEKKSARIDLERENQQKKMQVTEKKEIT